MNAVERQNRGGHVRLYRVSVDYAPKCWACLHVAAMNATEAICEARAEDDRFVGRECMVSVAHGDIAGNALLWARRALAQARAEAGRSGR